MYKTSLDFSLQDLTGLIENDRVGLKKLAYAMNVPSEVLIENPMKYLKELIHEDASRFTLRFALLDSTRSVRGVAVVENSKWDSEHFGLGVGKLKLAFFNRGVASDGRSRLFRSVKSTAFSRGLDVVFARVDLDDMLTIHSLESEGAILTDVLLSFRTDLKRYPTSSGLCPKVQVVQASLDDEELLVGIAKDVFKNNHFHADPRLPRDKCDEVYAKWVSGCLRGLADVVLVAKKKGKPLGFISCKVEGADEGFSRGIIDLIGVKKRFEGRGIGSCLMAEALKWFSSRSKSVYVGTQAANISAVRLYEKMGFCLVSTEATLHLWARSA